MADNKWLTDDDLALVEEEYVRSVKRDLAEALAEIERQRAREAAMRSLLASLALEAPDDHRALVALQEQARALLAS